MKKARSSNAPGPIEWFDVSTSALADSVLSALEGEASRFGACPIGLLVAVQREALGKADRALAERVKPVQPQGGESQGPAEPPKRKKRGGRRAKQETESENLGLAKMGNPPDRLSGSTAEASIGAEKDDPAQAEVL